MNKRFKGFTIAELLIALLIISIVLAAAIPTITKRKAGSEAIWQWAETRNSTYFSMLGDQASVIIGNTFRPAGEIMSNKDSETSGIVSAFGNNQDKLVVVKPTKGVYGSGVSYNIDGHDIPGSSHISFYNVHGVSTKTMTYSGRLALDGNNIGLGVGVLEKLQPSACTGSGATRTCTSTGNIAIGQYAEIANTTGSYNTAIGTKSLATNTQASFNTMLGYKSGIQLHGNGQTDTDEHRRTSSNFNTGIGSFVMPLSTTGSYNTALGSLALYANTTGSYNTAVGTGSCYNIVTGNYNVCLGYNADKMAGTAASVFESRYGTNLDDLLYIGVGNLPLITGRMNWKDASNPRNFALNTQYFDVNTTSSIANVFRIEAYDNATPPTAASAKLTFKPYQVLNSSGESTSEEKFEIVPWGDSHSLISLNHVDKNNNLKPLSLSRNAVIISSSQTAESTPPQSNLTINSEATAVQLYTNTIDGATNTPRKDMIFNEGKLSLLANGDTVLKNGSNTNAAGSALLSLNSNGFIFLHSQPESKIVLESTTGIMLKNSNASQPPYLEINGSGAVFKVEERHENVNDFVKAVTMEGTLHVTGDASFTKLGDVTTYRMGGDTLVSAGGIADLKGHLASVWEAIIQVNKRVTTATNIMSDVRLKNIQGENTAGLKEINALKVKNFTYKDDKEKTPHVGVIAQELQKVFPNSVFKGEDGYFRIRTEEIFYAMVNSIKELCTQVKDLTAKVTGLDNRIKKLEQENAQLKKQNAEFEQRLKKLEAKVK